MTIFLSDTCSLLGFFLTQGEIAVRDTGGVQHTPHLCRDAVCDT